MELNWQIKHFKELSLVELYDVLALRTEVFVVEQNCPYQELDGKDKKAYHVLGRNGKGDLVGTARLLPEGISYSSPAIGRFVLHPSARGNGNGHTLLDFCICFIEEEMDASVIMLSAQKHLEEFYSSHGFSSTGKEYLEDGIPHVEMERKRLE